MKRFSYALMALLLALILVLGISCKADTPVPDDGTEQTDSGAGSSDVNQPTLKKTLSGTNWSTLSLETLGHDMGVLSFDENGKPVGIPLDGYSIKTDTSKEYAFELKNTAGTVTETYSFSRVKGSTREIVGRRTVGEKVYETSFTILVDVSSLLPIAQYCTTSDILETFISTDSGALENIADRWSRKRCIQLEVTDEFVTYKVAKYYKDSDIFEPAGEEVVKVTQNEGRTGFLFAANVDSEFVAGDYMICRDFTSIEMPTVPIAAPDWLSYASFVQTNSNGSPSFWYFDSNCNLVAYGETIKQTVLEAGKDEVILVNENPDEKTYIYIYRSPDLQFFVQERTEYKAKGRIVESAIPACRLDTLNYANTVWKNSDNTNPYEYLMFDNHGMLHFIDGTKVDMDSSSCVDSIEYMENGGFKVFFSCSSSRSSEDSRSYGFPSIIPEGNIDTRFYGRKDGNYYDGNTTLSRVDFPAGFNGCRVEANVGNIPGTEAEFFDFINGRPTFIDDDDIFWTEYSTSSFRFLIRKVTAEGLSDIVDVYGLQDMAISYSTWKPVDGASEPHAVSIHKITSKP